ncbi:hypothetical protein A6A04_11470 [Paramagnetospirillum marisnigri]|uniref:histidine kinase n=1 Tax=Paramagnetospirillum marisnigri TaxID=1285242 RepID=A0A178MZ98_9PROT|nr:ATP-binding protein [Paramagnetospirillum marisnigri]OAN55268.1 hypothetical protein A6A04_11470 [Paramagnetospirillum marisnigri]
MSASFPYPPSVVMRNSLRLRLLLVSVVVEVVMLTLLVANGVRLIETHLTRNAQVRLEAQESSFNITLASQLAERDYAALQSILDGWGASGSITYMVVSNTAGKVVASVGRDASQPLPPSPRLLSSDLDEYQGAFDVVFLGQRYGEVRYGIDTRFLGLARSELLRQSLGIAATEVVLTIGLLAVIGYWLTRHLHMLARASLKLARGDYSQRLKIEGQDEIAVLTQTFNTMAEAVESRILDLEESHKRFRAIADYTYAWENWFGPDGRLRWVNPAVEAITGYTVAECHAMTDFPLPLVLEADRPSIREDLALASEGGSGQDREFRIRKRDGSEIWVAMSWQPIFDGAGESLGSRSSIRDITMQKHGADMLVEAKAELERLLFAASHDLKEPIREILSYTQRLGRDLGPDMSERVQEDVNVIQTGANQLNLLVKGLADYTRSNRPMAAFVPVDCRKVVDKVLAECRAMSGDGRVRFEVGALPVLPGDPVLLFIVFENLISNAIKFVRPDTPPVVTISSAREGPGWRIDIADNGIGIEPEYLQTIIRPFSRLHSRATYPGAGLGLSSSMKAARIHGGRLWLDSAPHQGTTVHIWLPAEDFPSADYPSVASNAPNT